MERFNDEGIDFAFPTKTLHIAGDEKMPLTVAEISEGRADQIEKYNFIPGKTLSAATEARISPITRLILHFLFA